MLEGISDAWSSMTDAQASVIAAILTIIAAISGVLLGSWLFGSRVRTLREALKETEKGVADFRRNVDDQLANIEPQIGAVLSLVQQLRTTAEDALPEEESADTSEYSPPTRDNLKAVWHQIRDEIEALASHQSIHGRTRAFLARIPRYSYEPLISALNDRGLLGRHTADFVRANEIWQNYQRRPADPSPAEYEHLRRIRDDVAGLRERI